jgi:hypothetical protein
MYSEKPNLHDVLCSDTADPIRPGRPREDLSNFAPVLEIPTSEREAAQHPAASVTPAVVTAVAGPVRLDPDPDSDLDGGGGGGHPGSHLIVL